MRQYNKALFLLKKFALLHKEMRIRITRRLALPVDYLYHLLLGLLLAMIVCVGLQSNSDCNVSSVV